mmetsp:Transcript_46897/g.87637  ORF Transcript_46897/g.87637 Transcript_46897/m.87637 type:complete len:225 (+) Transcript_46897:55-729(+)
MGAGCKDAMRRLLLPMILLAGANGQQVKRPIVTTDLIHGTGELLYDMYSVTYNKFLAHHVERHSKTVRDAIEPMIPPDPMGELCLQVGVEKQEIFKRVDTAAELANNAKQRAQVHGSRIYDLLSQGTHVVVDGIERLLPAHKGIVARTPGDLLLFCIWIVVVLYITMQVALIAFRISLRIFWFGLKLMCCGCCGLCCGSRNTGTKPSNSKTKPQGKAKGAAKKK